MDIKKSHTLQNDVFGHFRTSCSYLKMCRVKRGRSHLFIAYDQAIVQPLFDK